MRIDSLNGAPAGHDAARSATSGQTSFGQTSFGQTMLMLERGMWPGAKAGSAAAAAMPRPAASAAQVHGGPERFSQATPGQPDVTGATAHTDAPPASASSARWVRNIAPEQALSFARTATEVPAQNAFPAPLRGTYAAPALESDAIEMSASHPVRDRQDAASTDHVTTSDASSAAVVLRFDAPLEQRKALFDAVSAELRKRGLAHRPIVINGTIYRTRGKP